MSSFLRVMRIALFLAVLAGMSLAGGGGSGTTAQVPGSASAETVRVAIGDSTYAFPTGYLASRPGPPAGTTGRVSFGIHLLLPNLEPLTRANASDFFHKDDKGKVYGGHSVLRASIDCIPGFKARSPRLIVEQELQLRKIPVDEYADLGHGLHKYPKSGRYTYDLYVQRLPDSTVLAWRCDQDWFARYPGCTVTTQWPNGMVVQYGLSEKYQNLMPQLDARLRSLIASFRVPDAGNARGQ